jgi:hypothetical protein
MRRGFEVGRRVRARLGVTVLVAAALLATPCARGTVELSTPEESEQGRVMVEHRVDANALKIHGTILLVAHAEAVDDDGYLIRIDACNKKEKVGSEIMIVQDNPGRAAGQPWPAAAREATIYQVGTTPYLTPQNTPRVVQCFVPDRNAAVVWACSQ